jgi:hypothetical protein
MNNIFPLNILNFDVITFHTDQARLCDKSYQACIIFSLFLYKLKLNIKFPLCLSKYNAMKTYWGSGGVAQCILNLGTSGGEGSASSPGHITPGERAPGTQWIGGFV